MVGGKLRKELSRTPAKAWMQQAIASGRMTIVDEQQVNSREEEIRVAGSCVSNDLHIIALAQISGARLLYSNDNSLRRDFQNDDLINGPSGKIYSSKKSNKWGGGYRKLDSGHKRLLRENACRS